MKSAKKLTEKLSKIVSSKNEALTPGRWIEETHRALRKSFDKAEVKKFVTFDDGDTQTLVSMIIDIFRDLGQEKPKELVELFDELKTLAKKATEDLQEMDFEADDE